MVFCVLSKQTATARISLQNEMRSSLFVLFIKQAITIIDHP